MPPGISNHLLFEKKLDEPNIMELKNDLKRNVDYKMCNEHVWKLFYALYGGGPEIFRQDKDIYCS